MPQNLRCPPVVRASETRPLGRRPAVPAAMRIAVSPVEPVLVAVLRCWLVSLR